MTTLDDRSVPKAGRGVRVPLFDTLVEWMNNVGTLLIIGLMVLIDLDVAGRNLFNNPIPGVVELSEAGIVIIVFLQVGHTLRVGRFMQSDGVLSYLSANFPRVATTLWLLFNVTGAVLFAFIVRVAYARFIAAWDGDYYKGNVGSFVMSTWPIELTILFGSVIMVLQFLVLAFGDLRALLPRT
ncbi:MAG: TRAP transporter small permease [Burkholderiales bacterium]|nr:TRAP transporter small permease [Burkholderiales bacterium]